MDKFNLYSRKKYDDISYLKALYIDKGMSLRAISRKLNISRSVIKNRVENIVT